MPTDNTKLSAIRSYISLLFKPGQLVEARAMMADGTGMRGFYFTDHDRMAQVVEKLDDDPRVTANYVVINACKPNLLKAREGCGCKKCASGTLLADNPTDDQVNQILNGPGQHLTSNDDVDTLCWMFIDVDTCRAPGFEHESSTKEEKAACKGVATAVYRYLVDEKGWPEPLLADSGNGYHILCKIGMMNSSHNIHMLVDCLKALAAKFNGGAAKIDCAVFNPARLTRAYGTTTRKGTYTDERPYRRNRIFAPAAPIREVPLDRILILGSDVPLEFRRRGDDIPELAEGFRSEDWIDWFEGQGAFAIETTRETNGMTVLVTDTCLTAGHKHTGSGLTGFIVGDTFGWHCFSDDCEGKTIGDVFRLLREAKNEDGSPRYAPYPHQIFKDEGLEAVLDGVEDGWIVEADEAEKVEAKAVEAEEAATAVDAPEPEPTPEEAGEEAQTGRKRLKVRKVRDVATGLLACVFRDPAHVLPKFIMTKAKIERSYMAYIEFPINEALICLIGYFNDTRTLPTKSELKNFIVESGNYYAKRLRDRDKDGGLSVKTVLDYIDNVADDPDKEYFVQVTELWRSVELEAQKRVTRDNFKKWLGQAEDVVAFRNEERRHWQNELLVSGEILRGPFQCMLDDVLEEFRKDIEGINDEHKFALGIEAIDKNSNIGLDGERTIFVYGPLSSFKTTAVMTMAVNAAMNGKNGLILVGEHQGLPMMKTVALMLGHFVKDDPEIGVLPDRQAWEGLERTATEEDFGRMRTLIERVRAGQLLPGYLGVQNIDALVQNEEDRLGAVIDYIHSFHQEFPLDFVVIDPLDQVMPASASSKDNAWLESKETLQRIQGLSRSFEGRGGKGLMVITSAQFTSKMQREIEKWQSKNAQEQNDYSDEIIALLRQVSQCQFFTTIGQTLDFGVGVATRVKGGREGFLVKGRNRFLSTFLETSFVVDPMSNVLTESPTGAVKTLAVAAPQADRVMFGEFDVL